MRRDFGRHSGTLVCVFLRGSVHLDHMRVRVRAVAGIAYVILTLFLLFILTLCA